LWSACSIEEKQSCIRELGHSAAVLVTFNMKASAAAAAVEPLNTEAVDRDSAAARSAVEQRDGRNIEGEGARRRSENSGDQLATMPLSTFHARVLVYRHY